MRVLLLVLVVAALHAGCASSARPAGGESLGRQVLETERAFARTMAARDHAAFASYLSEEAVFFSGEEPLRGKRQVSEGWRPFFEGPDAPFSWEPERVEVLGSGALALSTGPVYDPAGKRVATFTSIWRQEAPGRWRIVFDRGNPYCEGAGNQDSGGGNR